MSPRRAVRLGLFGGSFNPIHLAHLRCAEEIGEALALDRVVFIPSASPPHKPGHSLVAAEHRLAMVRGAVRGNPRFRVSAMELSRGGHSYTVDTLRVLRRRLGPAATLYFLLGADAFSELATWKEYDAIFSLAHLVVLSRPPYPARPPVARLPVAVRRGFCYRASHDGLIDAEGHQILFRTVTPLDISASDIRARVARGQSVRYLVPDTVARYIAHHRLYARERRHQ
jgi:nicotinate-nucleotide adenylyltransferase